MARAKHQSKTGQLRIIGGAWRGRKLIFVAEEGLRPTGDRVRETLFNWLSPVIADARCADLFCGSGALGLEALSRGAAHCDFIDISKQALVQVQKHLTVLEATQRGTCHRATAFEFMRRATEPYDIVFLDPPFGQRLLEKSYTALDNPALLNSPAYLYIECEKHAPLPPPPATWHLHREKAAGEVRYQLLIHKLPTAD